MSCEAKHRLPSTRLLNTRRRIISLIAGGHLINEQQLSELNTALVKARADTAEAKARLDRVSQILRSDDLDPTAAEVATVADALQKRGHLQVTSAISRTSAARGPFFKSDRK